MRNASAEVRDTAATGGVRWMGVGVGVGGFVRKTLFPEPRGAVLLATVTRKRASRTTSPVASLRFVATVPQT